MTRSPVSTDRISGPVHVVHPHAREKPEPAALPDAPPAVLPPGSGPGPGPAVSAPMSQAEGLVRDGWGSKPATAPDSTSTASSSTRRRRRARPNGLDAVAVRCLRTKPEDREMTKRADQARRHTWVWRSLVAKNEGPGVVPGPQVSGPRADGLQPFWIRDFEERYLLANRAEADAAEERRAESAQE